MLFSAIWYFFFKLFQFGTNEHVRCKSFIRQIYSNFVKTFKASRFCQKFDLKNPRFFNLSVAVDTHRVIRVSLRENIIFAMKID